MIGKVPPAGRGFQGLVRYLLEGGRKSSLAQRVAWTATRQLLSDDPAKAPKLMRLTAAKSVRVQRPVYHVVISWSAREQPSDAQMQQVADTACHDLGLEDYQRVYIAHRDRNHPHVHIVVNRIHPESGKAWQTSHDYRRLERSVARQAQALGFSVVPGRHNQISREPMRPGRVRDGALRRAERLGIPVRERFPPARLAELQGHLRPLFASSASWAELTADLSALGLFLEPKGQGLVLTDGTLEMKLSDLGAGVRKAALEARFGSAWNEHTAGPQSPRRGRSRER